MRNYEALFGKLKCVRCGSRERLVPYEISKIVDNEVVLRQRHTTTYLNTKSRVKLPICSNCNLEFKRWKRFDNKNKGLYRGVACYGFMLVLLFLLAIANSLDSPRISPLFYIIPILLIPLGTCLTYAILISRNSGKMGNNPKHSMKFIAREVYVKPLNSLTWISYLDWINNTIKNSVTEDIERDLKSLSSTEYIKTYFEYCLKCNAKLDKAYKFCRECGEPIN